MSFITVSIIVISIIGTLSHFLYDITSHNKIIGLFTAVNESTWEHIKIALTPTLLWSLVDGYIYGMNSNYFLAKFVSLIIIILLMPIIYYGYQFILKKEIVIFNIMSFYIVIICSQLAFNYLIRINSIEFIYNYLSCIGIFLVFGGYMIHTLLPAKNFIFKDPITDKYGFKGHRKNLIRSRNE
ncbi:MAG: hypothetical protein IJK66_04980 [Bacilli bacterium]|nr:hypothetical protein [Bacilli bacterium]